MIFTRPGCVTGVFQRGVPVVPHPRLADSAGQHDNVPYPIGLPKIYRLQGILRFRTGCRARRAARRRAGNPDPGEDDMASQPGIHEIRPTARATGLARRDLLRRGAAGAGLLAAGPVLAACSSATATSSSSASASAGTPKRGGMLSFGRQTGPTQLDPANSIVEGDVYTLDKILEPLYITSPAGQLVPWLAQGHTVSTDGKTWTFALRPGVKLSDGKPVTATLSQPWAPFLSDISVFANAIVPKDLGGQSASSFFASPVGTGPYSSLNPLPFRRRSRPGITPATNPVVAPLTGRPGMEVFRPNGLGCFPRRPHQRRWSAGEAHSRRARHRPGRRVPLRPGLSAGP